jgi:DivIVA domain-containing protein
MIRMASSEGPEEGRPEARTSRGLDEPRQTGRAGSKGQRGSHRSSGRAIGSAERDRMLKEARNVDFPAGVRGYQRAAVDRYVERVNRLITELEMYSSPESAVRHALDEVSEETREILQRAHQTAEEITVRAGVRADERLEQADREAQEMLATAERQAQNAREAAAQEARQVRESAQRETEELREAAARETAELREAAAQDARKQRADAQREAEELLDNARREAEKTVERAQAKAMELARNADAMWRERRRLIEDVRAVGEQLVSLGEVEAKRFPHLPDEASLVAGETTEPSTNGPAERVPNGSPEPARTE